MEGQVAFSFAAPLAADEYVGESAAPTPETSEPSGNSGHHVRRHRTRGVHDKVRFSLQQTGGGFGWRPHDLVPRFLPVMPSRLMAFGKLVVVAAQMHMQEPPSS
jgi:hypothetical protein